jgi:hypothetical protein
MRYYTVFLAVNVCTDDVWWQESDEERRESPPFVFRRVQACLGWQTVFRVRQLAYDRRAFFYTCRTKTLQRIDKVFRTPDSGSEVS